MKNFWLDKRVFVTGASGLVGGWLIDSLVKQGADVVALVRDWVPHSRFLGGTSLSKCTMVRGDLSDAKFLERVLAEYEISVIFHLAAQTIVPIANTSPLSTFESNIAGTWNLLEASRQLPHVKSIVVASSDKAYGDADQLPYKETMPLKATFPYDVSKACTDMIASCYAKTWDIPVATTRCGNFFGGGDLNWNRIIPGTIRSVIRGKKPIIRSDGKLIRDYIYVEDAASAYMTLAEKLYLEPEIKGEPFNFSNETQMDVLSITNKILGTMGSDLEPIVLNEANAEIQAQYLDSHKANTVLGWKPIFGMEAGLEKTISWYQSHFEEV